MAEKRGYAKQRSTTVTNHGGDGRELVTADDLSLCGVSKFLLSYWPVCTNLC